MNANARRLALESRILDLTAARDAADTEAEKAALLAQIRELQRAVRDINILEADALGARIDAILAEIDAVRNARPLDAGSALERAFNGLRDFRRNL